jgi:hypothetical protein
MKLTTASNNTSSINKIIDEEREKNKKLLNEIRMLREQYRE